MNHKSYDNNAVPEANKSQDLLKKARYKSQLDDVNPYDTGKYRIENLNQTNKQGAQEVKGKQKLGIIQISKAISQSRDANSTSRSFFSRRPKTQMNEVNSNSTFNQIKKIQNRKYTHFEENSLEQIDQEHTTFGEEMSTQTRNNKTFDLINNSSVFDHNKSLFSNGELIKLSKLSEQTKDFKSTLTSEQ